MENLSEENLRFLLRNQSNSDCKFKIESLIQFMSDKEMTEELKSFYVLLSKKIISILSVNYYNMLIEKHSVYCC